MTGRALGITVMPEYIQSDGPARVLEQIADRAEASVVTTSPYVAAQAAAGTGHREPPDDGGAGTSRLLDRPLWGAREVWMDTAPSFVPDMALYEGLTYRPPDPTPLTARAGAQICDFLDAAAGRGMTTWLQIQAAIPPCHRVQFGNPTDIDQPLLPNGRPVPGRVDRNATLASEDLRAYMRAFVTDLWRTYPQVSGLKFDWPEYPVYTFDALFFDFNPSAARFAAKRGIDFERMRAGCLGFLSDLENGALRGQSIALDDLESFRVSLFAIYPALAELLAFRTALVTDYARFLRQTVDEASDGRCKLFLQCFPPPLNQATGFDLSQAGAVADVVGVKLYTMHWPLIEAEFLAALRGRAEFSPRQVMRALRRILRLSPDTARRPDQIGYPEPDCPHPAASADLAAKVARARAELPAGTRLEAISHGYGPTDDVMRRFEAVAEAPCDGVNINRYCYLGDDKLDALGVLMRRAGQKPDSNPARH